MKNTSRYLFLFTFLCLLPLVSITAHSKSQSAHTHGLATLTLALEKEVLEIQFASPAANLVGFEHKATSAQEKKVVTQAKTVLQSPQLLFSFVGANCKPKETHVDISEVLSSEQDRHDHHDEHKHHNEHKKPDGHKHHSDHKDHGEHKNHSDDSNHSEIIANYRFSCAGTKSLNAVSIALFNQFPRIEKINAIWVTESQQGSQSLLPKQNTVSLP